MLPKLARRLAAPDSTDYCFELFKSLKSFCLLLAYFSLVFCDRVFRCARGLLFLRLCLGRSDDFVDKPFVRSSFSLFSTNP